MMNRQDWREGTWLRPRLKGKYVPPSLSQEKWKRPGWIDDLRYLLHASSGFFVVFLVLHGSS